MKAGQVKTWLRKCGRRDGEMSTTESTDPQIRCLTIFIYHGKKFSIYTKVMRSSPKSKEGVLRQ